jgi:hypothetical protein
MLHLVKTGRTYPPETAAVMTAAFDRVRQSLSTRMNGNESVRQTLALITRRHFDLGGRDPVRLFDVAIPELAGSAALSQPGRPGVRKIAARFGVDPSTVQRISRAAG